MNQRVTKLLHQYASITDQDIKSLKKWWNSLNWQERSKARKQIEEDLGLNEPEDVEAEEE